MASKFDRLGRGISSIRILLNKWHSIVWTPFTTPEERRQVFREIKGPASIAMGRITYLRPALLPSPTF